MISRVYDFIEALELHFLRFRSYDYVKETIYWCQKAASHPQCKESYRGYFYDRQAVAYRRLFEHDGRRETLDSAQDAQLESLKWRPAGHPFCGPSLGGLALTFSMRFRHFGSRDDLEAAIRVYRESLSQPIFEKDDRLFFLANLGSCLQIRFQYFGQRQDIEEAVMRLRDSIEGVPETDSAFRSGLGNLAVCLHTRFDISQSGDLSAIIDLYRRVVGLMDEGSPDRLLWLGNLATALQQRFANSQERQDLDEALAISHAVLQARSKNQNLLSQARDLSNMAAVLILRFKELRDNADLERAVQLYRDVLKMRPMGHPAHAQCHENLSLVLSNLHDQCDDIHLFTEALEHALESVNVTPTGDPHRSYRLVVLALLYLKDTPQASFERAMNHLFVSVVDHLRHPRMRLQSANEVLARADGWATREGFSSASRRELVHAYQKIVLIFPQVAAFDLDVENRLESLKVSEKVASRGACHALVLQEPTLAVELLEEGRAVFWAQALRLRTQFDDLRDVDPALADDLRRISQELGSGGHITHGLPLQPTSYMDDNARVQESIAAHRRELSERFDDCLSRARKLPGFDRFLLGSTSSMLSEVAARGPVILLVASELSGCHAIIIAKPGHVEQLPLPVTEDELSQLAFEMKENVYLRSKDGSSSGGRGAMLSAVIGLTASQKEYLRQLWIAIVEPICVRLKLKVGTALAYYCI